MWRCAGRSEVSVGHIAHSTSWNMTLDLSSGFLRPRKQQRTPVEFQWSLLHNSLLCANSLRFGPHKRTWAPDVPDHSLWGQAWSQTWMLISLFWWRKDHVQDLECSGWLVTKYHSTTARKGASNTHLYAQRSSNEDVSPCLGSCFSKHVWRPCSRSPGSDS